MTPTELRARAAARRAALGCDNEVARAFDAAAEAIDNARTWSRRWKARAKIGRADARMLDATAGAFDGYAEDMRGAQRVIAAALAWRAAVQACDGWQAAEERLMAALDESAYCRLKTTACNSHDSR